MEETLFSHFLDDDDIWHLRFGSGSRQAIQLYTQTITSINERIVSGDLITNNPVLVLWDFTEGYFPNLQKMILQARMHPPPPELSYRIAYILNVQTLVLQFNVFKQYMITERIERRIFKNHQRAMATAWLLEAKTTSKSE